MSALIACHGLSKTYGARPLFEGLDLTLRAEDRVGLIGANGSGKSTLVRLLAGEEEPDAGEIQRRRSLRFGYAPQEPTFREDATPRQVLQQAASAIARPGEDAGVAAEKALTQAAIPGADAPVATLSGGWRKRLSIAAALVADPDLVLLDEPVNHLDLEGILWLERLLERSPCGFLLVSHDRYLLERVATRVIEIGPAFPGGLFSASGSLSTFLEEKAAFLTAQSRRREALENRLRREVAWLRRGPKARTSKARARIDAADSLAEDVEELRDRERAGGVDFAFEATGRRTKELLSVNALSVVRGDRTLVRDLSLTLRPGERVGVVGPNGSGKTSLLEVLSGRREPGGGERRTAQDLRTVYFDQKREDLDPRLTLARALAPDGDGVVYRGQLVPVQAWAARFQFREEQLPLPVGELSGGERARVIISRLIRQEADVLLLDEPTNDLDLSTLETLEESLESFPGAIVLVTHDRYLLDRLCGRVVGLDGEGGAGLYAGYEQWLDERASARAAAAPRQKKDAKPRPARRPGNKKLSYHEQREWDGLEERIEQAESRVAEIKSAIEDPSNASDPQRLTELADELAEAEATVTSLLERWAELDDKRRGS